MKFPTKIRNFFKTATRSTFKIDIKLGKIDCGESSCRRLPQTG